MLLSISVRNIPRVNMHSVACWGSEESNTVIVTACCSVSPRGQVVQDNSLIHIQRFNTCVTMYVCMYMWCIRCIYTWYIKCVYVLYKMYVHVLYKMYVYVLYKTQQ